MSKHAHYYAICTENQAVEITYRLKVRLDEMLRVAGQVILYAGIPYLGLTDLLLSNVKITKDIQTVRGTATDICSRGCKFRNY